jgi:hypothetical protein
MKPRVGASSATAAAVGWLLLLLGLGDPAVVRAEEGDRFRSLSLRSRTPKPTGSSLGDRYLAAPRTNTLSLGITPAHREIAEYLSSTPIAGTVRAALLPLLQKQTGEWMATPASQLPTPTGDRAGVLKRVFPELVSNDLSSGMKATSLHALVQLFDDSPDHDAVVGCLTEQVPVGVLIQYARGTLPSPASRGVLQPTLLARLARMEAEASQLRFLGTAAALALHAHQLSDGTELPARPLTAALPTPDPKTPPGLRAQHHAAQLLGSVWPALAPTDDESPPLHQLLTREPTLAETRVQRGMRLVPGDLATLSPLLLAPAEPGTPFQVLAGAPPRLRMQGVGDVAEWPDLDDPELAAQLKRVRQAERAAAAPPPDLGEIRRRNDTRALERELAQLRAESGNSLAAAQYDVAAAERALANARNYRSEQLRIGAYVGQDPNRLSRSITRELNALERSSLDQAVMSAESNLEFARRMANQTQYNQRGDSSQESALVERIQARRQAIRDAERSAADRVERNQQALATEQARLDALRAAPSRAPAKIGLARDLIREQALRDDRRRRLDALLESVELRRTFGNKGVPAEKGWIRWWLGRLPDTPETLDIGNVPIPRLPLAGQGR